MEGPAGQYAVHVEGIDDVHTIKHLLRHHAIAVSVGEALPGGVPTIVPAGDVGRLLDGITASVRASAFASVGFVLDADAPLIDRWRSVRDRLARVDVAAPETPPPEGFVGASGRYKSTVGVWLMPDNRRDGTLEDFLRMLIDEGDALIDYANRTATYAREKKGARFPAVQHDKAVIHTWLAWQKTPGLPYGSAVAAHFFRHDSPAALAFVAWFKRLFAIETAVPHADRP